MYFHVGSAGSYRHEEWEVPADEGVGATYEAECLGRRVRGYNFSYQFIWM